MGKLELRAAEFHRLATTDALTGLANRRTAEQELIKEMARSRRRREPLAIVAIDLNNFKQTNDRYGHAAGDLILCEFGRKLTETVRATDLPVRMGGDEFLVVLPECTVEQAPLLLARLRSCETNFQGVRLPIEFSFGCVSYQTGETPEQLLERADQALYADKRARRTRSATQAILT
jgi:diguanylate cyclase (GGDEF)-like protein